MEEETLLTELNRLNDAYIFHYRHGRYAEAIRAARKALLIAREELSKDHLYIRIFKNNLKAAIVKFRENAVAFTPGQSEINNKQGALKNNFLCKRKFSAKLLFVMSVVFAVFFLGYTMYPSVQGRQTAAYSQPGLPAEHIHNMNKWLEGKEAVFPPAYELKEKTIIEAPLILQNPELPRGCEVTSLAMLLRYAGVPVDKMALAAEIKKDPSPYEVNGGRIYFGNPYIGFVGSMFSLNEPGYGVYHGPIRELMEKYLPGKTIDLTGCAFEDVLVFLNAEVPVWVIVNATFCPLDAAEFMTWYTSRGPLQITYRQHAVLLTGYDQQYVYFNDPLNKIANSKAEKEQFIAAWEQMGQQAVTYIPY